MVSNQLFHWYTSQYFSCRPAVLHHTKEYDLLNLFFANLDHGIYIDVGGNVPNNAVSKPFHDKGWMGVVVEPIPENAARFRETGWTNVKEAAVTSPAKAKLGTTQLFLAGGDNAPHSSLEQNQIDPNSLNTEETIVVNLTTLQDICDEHQITHINLLSIDTEGTELDVLQGLNFLTSKVDLILCEDWQRDSLIHRYLVAQGYKVILRTGFNSWYIPRSIDSDTPTLGKLNLWKKIYVSSYIKRLRHWISVQRRW